MAPVPSSEPMAASFQVLVLGPFALQRNGVLVDVSEWSNRVQRGIRILVTTPGRRCRREEAIDRPWPEATPQAGSSNLRYILHFLRRAFPSGEPPPVLSEHGWIMLNPFYRWEVDLERFEALAQAADDQIEVLEEAVALYRGECLLEDRYEEWAAPLRRRAERIWRDLCIHLARVSRARGDHTTAARHLEQVIEHDPVDEEVVQLLLATLGELGRRTEALRLYRHFEERLTNELGLSPTPQTRAIVASLKAPTQQVPRPSTAGEIAVTMQPVPIIPSYPLPSVGSFVGRDTEVREIIDSLLRTNSGAPRLVLVSAEAGTGKTRLLGEAAQRARDCGALTLAGGCFEQEGHLPYGPIHDALADYVRTQSETVLRTQCYGLLTDLVRVVPELHARIEPVKDAGRGSFADQRLRLFSAVAQLLRRLTASQPVLLLLDDLHWADDSTLQLLHFLTRQPEMNRLLVVGAYRQEEVLTESPLARLVSELKRTARARLLSLRPLTEDELALLLTHWHEGSCAPDLAENLFARSGGNPFFAQEMVRLLQHEQQLVWTKEGWQLAPQTTTILPGAVRETIARRLRQLAAEWREVLAYGALLGRTFAYAALEAAWMGDEQTLLDALEAGLETHLLSETAFGYTFRHPLLREVLYESVPSPRRMQMQKRIGLALETLYGREVEAHAAELAHHFAAAGPTQRDRAVRYFTLAGSAAARAFANAEALECYRRALELLEDAAARADLHERMGEVEAGIGHIQSAIEHFRTADTILAAVPSLAESEQRGRLALKLARQLTLRRELTAADQAIEMALRLLPHEAAERSAVFVVQGLGQIYGGNYAAARAAAERALQLADASGVPDRILEAFSLVGHPSITIDGPKVTAILHERLPVLKQQATPALYSEAALLYVWHRIWMRGVFGTEEAVLAADAKAAVARMGAIASEAHACMVYGAGQVLSGEWPAAKEHLLRMLDLTTRLERPPSPQGFFLLGILSLGQGKFEKAHAYLRQGLAQLDNWYWVEPPHGGIWLNQAVAEWCVATGDHVGAVQSLGQAEEAAGRLACQNCTCILSAVAAEVYAQLGRPDQARTLAQRAFALSEPLGREASRGVAERALAQCAALESSDAALEHGLRSVEIFRRLAQPYELARSLRVLGVGLIAAGDHRAAHGVWQEAITLARRVEAIPELERISQLIATNHG